MSTLTRIGELFKGKDIDDRDGNRQWKDKKIDPSVVNSVMEEVESRLEIILVENIGEIGAQMDYRAVLEDKKLLEFYEGFKEQTRKTRFMFGYMDYIACPHSTPSPVLSSPGLNYTPPPSSGWKKYFAFMITNKSYVITGINSIVGRVSV